jgi:hypothetical protein
MRDRPGCPVAGHPALPCRPDPLAAAREGAAAAVAFLRDCLKTFPLAARRNLEAAAGHYDRLADLLQPPPPSDAAGDRRPGVPAHLVRQGRQVLNEAADRMDRALAAE